MCANDGADINNEFKHQNAIYNKIMENYLKFNS
jgi:hypothetical protein